MSIEGEYRCVRFGTEDQIIKFLTDKLRQELNPQTREIILNVINEIGHRFTGRSINAIKGRSSAELPPDLISGLKLSIGRIVKKELDNRQLGQDRHFTVRREVCLGLRFYMDTLPTVNLSKKEKQREASSSSSFSSSSSSSTLGSSAGSSSTSQESTPVPSDREDLPYMASIMASDYAGQHRQLNLQLRQSNDLLEAYLIKSQEKVLVKEKD